MRLLPSVAFAAIGPLAALVAQTPQEPVPPNYGQHVAPVLKARCVTCHRTGGAAPFSLETYGQAKKWSAMSLQTVHSRRMPPWKPLGTGIFHDENRMTPSEVEVLRAWEKAGTPKGPDAVAETAKPPEPVIELGTPDKLLQPARPYVVSGGAQDEYRYFVVRNPYRETKWLRGVEMRPGNPRVVHHATVFVDGTGMAAKLAAAGHDGQAGYSAAGGPKFMPSSVIGFWAPGMKTRPLPEGTGFELKPGDAFVIQVHYVSTGKAETDRWSLGLHLADAPPKRALLADSVERRVLSIPAGRSEVTYFQEQTIGSDATIWAIMPHAHRLGKRMVAEARLPSGKRQRLIEITDWDPAWQSLYWFKQPVSLPKGTVIRFEATYDNSAGNPRNPNDPPRLVQWGEEERNEMMLLAFLYTKD